MSIKFPKYSWLKWENVISLLLLMWLAAGNLNAQIKQQDPLQLYADLQKEKVDSVRLRLLSDFAWQIHNSDSSQHYYKAAIDLSLELNDYSYLAQNYNRIGITYRNYDLHEKALEFYEKALTLAQSTGNWKEEGFALNNIAQILYYQENYTDALIYYSQAKEIFKDKDFQEGLGYTYLGKSRVYEKTGDYIRAIQAIDKSLEIRGHQVDRNFLASILVRGDFYLLLKDFDKAKGDYDTYYSHVKDIYPRGEMTVYGKYAHWYFEQGQLDQAFSYAKKAMKIHKEQPSLEIILPLYLSVSQAYAARGDFELAYHFQQAYSEGKDQLLDSGTQNYLANLKIRRQEAEIKSLETANRLQEERESQKRLINLALLIGLILSACIIVIYYQSFQKEKKNLARLDQQKMEIQQQAEQLEVLNNVKDKLFSIIAHDLRGPINSLKGLIELLEEENLTEVEFREILPLVSQNVGHNSILLENLLMWSRTQMEGMNPVFHPTKINSIYRENQDYLQLLANSKNITLLNLILDEVVVMADKGMVDIVMRNLLTNAIKFTPEGGQIELTVEDLIDQWKIIIADNGVGIAQEHIDKIFGSHFHTTAGTKQEKGSGLGLLLSKELIEKNNGKIWLDSHEGAGSTFYFTLPKA